MLRMLHVKINFTSVCNACKFCLDLTPGMQFQYVPVTRISCTIDIYRANGGSISLATSLLSSLCSFVFFGFKQCCLSVDSVE